MPISESEFRNALACFASGVNIVTTIDAAGNLHGLTVSAFCSVSLSPPLVLICIEKITASHYAFRESGAFVVNILSKSQSHLSEHFATPIDNKFGIVEYRPGIAGIPVIEGTLANLECRIVNTFDGGDHSIFVAQIEQSRTAPGEALVYYQHAYNELRRLIQK